MQHRFPVHIIVVVVIGVLTFLLRQRQAGARQKQGDEYIVSYSSHWRVLALLGILFPVGLLIAVLFNPDQADRTAFGLIAVFSALGVYLVYETRREVRVSVRGVRMVPLWGSPVSIPWARVSELKVRKAAGDLELRSRDGAKLRVPLYMSGLATVAEHCERHLPPAVVAADALGHMRAQPR